MIKSVFLFVILYTFLLYSCSNDTQKKRYKTKYYSSGRVETMGWYVQDTIPVDTLYTFYESGKILARDIYDNIGNAVKSISYFENCNIHKIIDYENGLANGFFCTYFASGGIASRAFFVNDLQIGDTYYYSQGGTVVKAYSFFDWKERPINLMK